MTRDERTIGEAEAELRGYEAAKAQAVALARSLPFVPEQCGAPEAHGRLMAAVTIIYAIARMQPEDKT